MLVVSRYLDESVIIGNGIRVTVVAVEGRRIKLGFDVPREIPVDRQEVHEQKQRQREAAARIVGSAQRARVAG